MAWKFYLGELSVAHFALGAVEDQIVNVNAGEIIHSLTSLFNLRIQHNTLVRENQVVFVAFYKYLTFVCSIIPKKSRFAKATQSAAKHLTE